MRLRPARATDSQLLLSWRNDPHTRRASLQTKTIAPEEHQRWFARTLEDDTVDIFIAELEGIPVGSVRAEQRDPGFALSWTVAPAYRGQGLGKKMVALLADRLSGPLQATIRKENRASIAIAQAVGMRLQQATKTILYFST